MNWAEGRPFAFETETGELAGLSIELAQVLSREVGFDVEFRRVSDLHTMVAAFGAGQSQIMTIIPKIDAIADTTVYSTPIFRQETRLMLRAEGAARIQIDQLDGLRVGTVAPSSGSDPDLLPGAEVLPYADIKLALVDLLSGQIDAISAPTHFTFPLARDAKVDHMVTYSPGSLLEYDLFVSLHESQAALLEPINTVLKAMEDDGRLLALSRKYAVALPETEPEVLTVGVYHFPPYQVVDRDGGFTGFSVEVLRDLAEQADLKLTFKELTLIEWQAGPGVGDYDLLPQAAINAERRARMDFTYPIEQAEIAIFVPAGKEAGISDLEDLVGLRVGVSETNLVRRIAEAHGGLTLVSLGDQDDHLAALLDGRVDAVLYPRQPFNALALEKGQRDRIAEIRPAFHVSQRAPALRPGLGVVREQLNAVIPQYLVSDDYREQYDMWFSEPVFWTLGRVYLLIGLGAASLVGLVGLAGLSFLQWQKGQQKLLASQRRELENETLYNEQLQTVVYQLERSNENLNDFAYIASHDLKEPLRGIAINADFLLREDVSGASKKRINRMVVLTTRMEQLISDLLFFSRLGRDEANREKVDLIKIVGNLKADLREVLQERGGQVTIATHLPRVSAERSRVRTVFYNLIMNGLTYNDSNPKKIEIGFLTKIVVNGKPLSDVFYVKDNGIGIDEKNRDKVYRIFTRLNRESDYGRGSGAGLSFVKKVLEIYDCDLTFESEVGEGTTFYFSLPVGDAPTPKIKELEGTDT